VWSPPQGARDLVETAAADDGSGGKASVLEGKEAPAFSLKDMSGKTVSLNELRGKVVVLDLWATWCPPCRLSLPHLDKLYAEMNGRPVAVYAVNIQEEKDDVQKFIEITKLQTPVLLDSDGAVGQKYHADAIPQTVVIGRDGKVAKVIPGFDPDKTPAELKAAVEKALN
jgi:peroxiredoxin